MRLIYLLPPNRHALRRVFTVVGICLIIWSSVALGFGKNKVQYKEFKWLHLRVTHFDIYYYHGGRDLAEFAAEAAERSYRKIRASLGYRLKKKVPIIVYNSHGDFEQTNVIPDLLEEGIQGFTEAFKNRVVIHFNGSYEEFELLLAHELTHAVVYDMIYGGGFGSFLSRQRLVRVPLWVMEGLAEYESKGWDVLSDMILRDGIISGYLPSLNDVSGYLAYKEGQSAIGYISEKYGQEKISEIVGKLHLGRSMDRTLRESIGLSVEELNDEWMMELKKRYWPEVASRREVKEFARQLTNHQKDPSNMNLQPAYSPKGDRLAYFSDRSDYTDIYLISTIDGKILDRLAKGERSAGMEEFNSWRSSLSWSPDGNRLTFAAKRERSESLYILDVKRRSILKRYDLDLDGIFSPAWSPNGHQIAFSGLKDGQTDLYLFTLATGSLLRLTDDKYDDIDPTWSPGGERIAFSSDRPTVDVGPWKENFIPGLYNIFIYTLKSQNISSLTANNAKDTSPAWSPDGSKLCFVSDINGISNLYVAELDSVRIYPITNVLGGCFSPSWSPDGRRIAFSAFHHGGWDVFILDDPHPHPHGEELALTPFLKLRGEKSAQKNIHVRSDTNEMNEKKLRSYVFLPPEDDQFVPISEDSVITPEAETGKTEPYRLKFTPDLVSGTIGYDTYFGLQGQSVVVISDLLGNHQIFFGSDLFYSIEESNIQLIYHYLPQRIDYRLGLFHFKQYYLDGFGYLFSDRIYGGMLWLTYPVSKFTRFDLGAVELAIDRRYYDVPWPKSFTRLFLPSLDLVNDTVIWGITGPINGSRSMVSVEAAPAVLGNTFQFTTIELDYRKYLHFKQRYSFALRLAGGASLGRDPRQFFLGGVSNWISPRLSRDNIYGVDEFYFARLITPLRGYEYYEVSGTKYGLINLEMRYPFIDYLALHWPLPFSISHVNGSLFTDIGGAWNQTRKFQGGNTDEDGTFRLKDLKLGFGYGARANLGFFILRFDSAWRSDLDDVSKPLYYFSLGAEF